MKYVYILFSFLIPITLPGQSKPTIVGQKPLITNEEQAITILLTDLFVVDRDNIYPFGFTLTIYEGSHYSFSQHTITPNENFYGELKVKVSVNDGQNESNKFDLKITVNPVNDPPVITGQKKLEILQGNPLTLQLSDLIVIDPDNNYPKDFTLSVSAGSNYTVNGTTVTPHESFSGSLSVPVTVNDGSANSNPFPLEIIVIPRNERPVITSQESLNTAINTPVTIEFVHLKVTDPDSKYPDDFTMTLYAGANYTFSGRTVTPANNFTGTLSVPVTVNDGTSNSEPFNVKIEVTNVLHIAGQVPLETNEDEAITLQLSHLTVYDPENKYPNGFALNVSKGDGYSVNGTTVQPALNYVGTLSVEVTVRNNSATSKPYNVAITVKPVNDAPVISSIPAEALRYNIGGESVFLFKEIEVNDVDDEQLVLAEVGFKPETFHSGNEELIVETIPGVQAVFDPVQGVLTLVGQAPVIQYQLMLKSVQYNYTNLENPVPATKIIYVKVNDGKAVSEPGERTIVMSEDVDLDIPTAFSPNNDAANDTWKIRLLRPGERFNNAIIRVFNKRGALVFETKGFAREWDGRYNGELLPPDTYFYTIDLNLSYPTKNYTGVVSILR